MLGREWSTTVRRWRCLRREALYWRWVGRMVAARRRVGVVPVDWHAATDCRCGR